MKPFEESDRYEYPLTPESVVIDLGCYRGDFAAQIHEKYGCRVFSFEPVAPFFDRCSERFKGHPKITVMNLAVGGENREVEGRIKGDMSGLFAGDGEPWKCRMIRGVGIFSLLNIDEVDLVKINIEGGEFDLLDDLVDSHVLHRFRNIQVQWHDVVPDARTRFEALQADLAETHHLTFDHGWVWQSWRLREQ
jgi:FkbM family methyltransferase